MTKPPWLQDIRNEQNRRMGECRKVYLEPMSAADAAWKPDDVDRERAIETATTRFPPAVGQHPVAFYAVMEPTTVLRKGQ